MTPETDTLPAHESDTLWTADSERSPIQTSDDATPTAPVEPESETAKAEAVAEPEAAAAPERDDKGQFQKRTGKKRDDPIARMQDATRKEAAAKEEARLAKEEAARYKAELDAARRPAPAPAPDGPRFQFPKFAQYLESHPEADYDDYQDAKADARETWRAVQSEAQSLTRTHAERLQAAAATDPALMGLIQEGGARIAQGLQAVGLSDIPEVLARAIQSSPRSVELFRHLVTHPEKAIQLAVESRDLPASAVGWIRRALESEVPTAAVASPEPAPVVRPSAAKPPITRVGGTASIPPAELEDLEFGPEYVRRGNAEDRKRKEAGRW